MYLINTNVLSELTKPTPNPAVLSWFARTPVQQVYISAVTVCEILLGLELMPEGKRRDAMYQACEALLTEDFGGRCLSLDTKAAAFYGSLAARQQQAGRVCSVEDALIAAIALANRYTLVTRNTKDFVGIAHLEVLNPWNS